MAKVTSRAAKVRHTKDSGMKIITMAKGSGSQYRVSLTMADGILTFSTERENILVPMATSTRDSSRRLRGMARVIGRQWKERIIKESGIWTCTTGRAG